MRQNIIGVYNLYKCLGKIKNVNDYYINDVISDVSHEVINYVISDVMNYVIGDVMYYVIGDVVILLLYCSHNLPSQILPKYSRA